MVVPGSAPLIQPDPSLGTELGRDATESSAMGPDAEALTDPVGPELEEVRKLQELVRRLELQNQQLRTRSLRSVPEARRLSQAGTGVDNCHARLNGMEMNNSINALMDKQELQIVADLHSALSKMRSGAEEADGALTKDVEATTRQHSCALSASGKEQSSTGMLSSDGDTHDFPDWDCGNAVLGEDLAGTGVEPALRASEGSPDGEGLWSETTLDGVEVLELENGSDEEESWLYVSPRKSSVDEKESPLQWCRQVLDHPSPETEAACRTLLSRLDQDIVNCQP